MGEAGVAAGRSLGEAREIPLSGRNTTVAFTVRWFGAITVHGRFTDVAGTLRIPPTGLEEASVDVDLRTASIRTGIRLRDRHLRARTFLDAARHPCITFHAQQSISEGEGMEFDLQGVLTVRGVARPVKLACVLDEPSQGKGSSPLLAASGTTTLQRRDFAVGSPLGQLSRDPRFRVIGDEVRVTVTVRAPLLAHP
jgi:polyisoprenoid-binding protein YceI